MKFFWPAPLDLIDPTFNFIEEKGQYNASKHKNQKLPHEIFDTTIYHGFIISKIYVEQGNIRWNSSQLNRFFREGAKRFLRLPVNSTIQIMGDSGAFTRSSSGQITKPVVDECLEVLEYYNAIGVDYGLSPDNIIGGYLSNKSNDKSRHIPEDWYDRWNRTLNLAETFILFTKKKKVKWTPIGVAQGWDTTSYQESVKQLENLGYSYIALGGLNRLQNTDIISVLKSCYGVKAPTTCFHLLGISRLNCMEDFQLNGVVSFDSAMPIRQAINDDKNNYHFKVKDYVAIRVPQTYKSPRLNRLISNGTLDGKKVLNIENSSLEALRGYDQEKCSIENVLNILQEGIIYRQEKDYLSEYERLLVDKPWKECSCKICQAIGIEVVLMRNRERNLRRGFHNLLIFSNQLNQKFTQF